MNNRYEVQHGTKGFALVDTQEKRVVDWFGADQATANGICNGLNAAKPTCPCCTGKMDLADYLDIEQGFTSDYICMNDDCADLVASKTI